MNINIVNLTGYVGIDPKIFYLESGNILVKFPIFVADPSKDNLSGQLDWDSLDCFDLEMWDRVAEIAVKYVHEGRLIGITGSLKVDLWESPETGEDWYKPIVVVRQIYLLGSRTDNKIIPSRFIPEEYLESQDCEENNYPNEQDSYDTSMDYGYLNDFSNLYEHFHSLGGTD